MPTPSQASTTNSAADTSTTQSDQRRTENPNDNFYQCPSTDDMLKSIKSGRPFNTGRGAFCLTEFATAVQSDNATGSSAA